MTVRLSHQSCAACEGAIDATPFRIMGLAYCCEGCSRGGPCVCTYDAFDAGRLGDLDGVDGLGLPFRRDAVPAPEYTQVSALVPAPSDGEISIRDFEELLQAVR